MSVAGKELKMLTGIYYAVNLLIEMLSATSFQRVMMKMYSLGKYRNNVVRSEAATIPISDRKTKCFFVHVLILQMKQ